MELLLIFSCLVSALGTTILGTAALRRARPALATFLYALSIINLILFTVNLVN